jgi:hypothetical protein
MMRTVKETEATTKEGRVKKTTMTVRKETRMRKTRTTTVKMMKNTTTMAKELEKMIIIAITTLGAARIKPVLRFMNVDKQMILLEEEMSIL